MLSSNNLVKDRAWRYGDKVLVGWPNIVVGKCDIPSGMEPQPVKLFKPTTLQPIENSTVLPVWEAQNFFLNPVLSKLSPIRYSNLTMGGNSQKGI